MQRDGGTPPLQLPAGAEEIAIVQDKPKEIKLLDDEFLVVGPTPFAHPCETRGGDVIGQPMPDDIWMEVVGFQLVQEGECHVGCEEFRIVHTETTEKRRDVIAGDFVAGELPIDDAVELSVAPKDVVGVEVAVAEIDGQADFRAGEIIEFLPDG